MYYHLSPLFRRFQIALNGLDVFYDARKKGRIWLCSSNVIDDVGFHLARRDDRVVVSYALWQVHLANAGIEVIRSGRVGVYYVTKRIDPIWCVYIGEVMYDLSEGVAVTFRRAATLSTGW